MEDEIAKTNDYKFSNEPHINLDNVYASWTDVIYL